MPSQFQIDHAVNTIRFGGVIAYATEAVYGLGCDPENAHAVERILAMKNRSLDQGLILIASNLAQVLPYLGSLSVEQESAIQTYWPGPTTLILPASSHAPGLVTGGRNTIAVRITAHPDVCRLCDALGQALVSTSANRSGDAPIKYSWQLAKTFGDEIDSVFPSSLGSENKPTEIRNAQTGQVLRSA